MQTEAAQKIYRLRGAIAEFPNAWLKSKIGLRQFCVRGLKKVRCEVLWACLTYNIQQWPTPVESKACPCRNLREKPKLTGRGLIEEK